MGCYRNQGPRAGVHITAVIWRSGPERNGVVAIPSRGTQNSFHITKVLWPSRAGLAINFN